MNATAKLTALRGKIERSTKLDKEFGHLAGIELFDYIQDHAELRDEMMRRVEYLNTLSKNATFIALQDRLYESICKLLKEIKLSDVKKVQTQWKNAFFNPLQGKSDFIKLPELYEQFLDKKSYYRLGDHTPFSYFDGDIIHAPTTAAVRKQYEIFDSFLEVMRRSEVVRAKWDDPKFIASLEEYNEASHELNRLTIALPIKLHISAFIDVLYFSIAVFSRPGYEQWHSFYWPALYQDSGPYKFDRIKDACITVIDDLIELQSNDSEGNSTMFSLAKNGKLTRRLVSSVETYAMKQGSLRHRLIKDLNRGSRSSYHDTNDLAASLDAKPADVRKAITDIKAQIKKNFRGLEARDFIDGKKNSGYRLASAVRIVEE